MVVGVPRIARRRERQVEAGAANGELMRGQLAQNDRARLAQFRNYDRIGLGDVVVSLGVFFLVIGILYVNSNLIHINPMLNLSGYHLYEISVESGATYSLITYREVIPGDTISAVKASNGIFLEAFG